MNHQHQTMESPPPSAVISPSSVRRGLVRRRSTDDDSMMFMKSSSDETMFLLASNPSFGVGSSVLMDFEVDYNSDDDIDDEDIDSESSLSTVDDLKDSGRTNDNNNGSTSNVLVLASPSNNEKNSTRFRVVRWFPTDNKTKSKKNKPETFDIVKYQAKRQMTVWQEKWNAITILPNPLYCLYFILAALWVEPLSSSSTAALDAVENAFELVPVAPAMAFLNGLFGADAHGCLPVSTWHSMPALPPLPVVAVTAGICLHAPFSCLYHWRYAHSSTGGPNHWSRRLDQSFIHVASALISYATSGSTDYFLANVLYNADCIRSLLRQRTVRPKRNQARIGISILAYLLPIVRRGDVVLFGTLCFLFGVSGWLFAAYPVGGWSHAAFHLVIALVPPFVLSAACDHDASQPQILTAALCLLLRAGDEQRALNAVPSFG